MGCMWTVCGCIWAIRTVYGSVCTCMDSIRTANRLHVASRRVYGLYMFSMDSTWALCGYISAVLAVCGPVRIYMDCMRTRGVVYGLYMAVYVYGPYVMYMGLHGPTWTVYGYTLTLCGSVWAGIRQ